MNFGMVNKLKIVNKFDLHTLDLNIKCLAIITRGITLEKRQSYCQKKWA